MKDFLEFIETVLLNLMVLVGFALMIGLSFLIMYACYSIIRICFLLLFI